MAKERLKMGEYIYLRVFWVLVVMQTRAICHICVSEVESNFILLASRKIAFWQYYSMLLKNNIPSSDFVVNLNTRNHLPLKV